MEVLKRLEDVTENPVNGSAGDFLLCNLLEQIPARQVLEKQIDGCAFAKKIPQGDDAGVGEAQVGADFLGNHFLVARAESVHLNLVRGTTFTANSSLRPRTRAKKTSLEAPWPSLRSKKISLELRAKGNGRRGKEFAWGILKDL